MTTNDDQNTGKLPSKISRRTLAAGAAWSVPVIAVASAAPAYALSGPGPSLTFLAACKFPGNSCKKAPKGYAFAFEVVNNDPNNAVVICDAEMLNVVGTDVDFNYTGSNCITIPADGEGTIYFFFAGDKDSSNEVFSFDLRITWSHNCPCSDDTHVHPKITIPVQVGGTPPHGVCQCDAEFIPAT